MALKYTVKTKLVLDEDGSEIGTVHGLSFNAIVGLVNLNKPVVEAIFNRFANADAEDISDDEIMRVGGELLQTAPTLIAQVIAAATDAYDDYDPLVEGAVSPLEAILDMPIGIQIKLLQEIMPLTFNAGGGVKKVLALALKAGQGVTQSEA